jgi:hypothetical protein
LKRRPPNHYVNVLNKSSPVLGLIRCLLDNLLLVLPCNPSPSTPCFKAFSTPTQISRSSSGLFGRIQALARSCPVDHGSALPGLWSSWDTPVSSISFPARDTGSVSEARKSRNPPLRSTSSTKRARLTHDRIQHLSSVPVHQFSLLYDFRATGRNLINRHHQPWLVEYPTNGQLFLNKSARERDRDRFLTRLLQANSRRNESFPPRGLTNYPPVDVMDLSEVVAGSKGRASLCPLPFRKLLQM